MRSRNFAVVFAVGAVIAACASQGAHAASLESRLAAQNALFEQQFQADLKTHPERATAYGDYRSRARP